MGLFSFLGNLFGGGSGKAKGDDTTLNCVQCKKPFVFEAGEQQFYKSRGLTPPKRCSPCRNRKRRRR